MLLTLFGCVRLSSLVFHIHITFPFLSYALKHVQEVFCFGCGEKKRYMYNILYWSEVNRNIIKPQFDFLHHQEEKALKRLWEVEI